MKFLYPIRSKKISPNFFGRSMRLRWFKSSPTWSQFPNIETSKGRRKLETLAVKLGNGDGENDGHEEAEESLLQEKEINGGGGRDLHWKLKCWGVVGSSSLFYV